MNGVVSLVTACGQSRIGFPARMPLMLLICFDDRKCVHSARKTYTSFFPLRIDPLRFQAGGRKRQPNLGYFSCFILCYSIFVSGEMVEVGTASDRVAPSRMVGVSASVNLPLHHKVPKFSSGIWLTRVVPEMGP